MSLIIFKRNFVLTSLVILLVSCGASNEPFPLDRDLEENYRLYREDYHRVAQDMVNRKIYRMEIGRDGTLSENPKVLQNAERGDYAKILRDRLKISLANPVFRKGSYDDIEEVYFYQFREGWVFGGQGKGVAFLGGTEPVNIVVSLDALDSKRKDSVATQSGNRVYKKLEDHWYLFYEYND